MVSIWEVGILIMGIGILILCIYLGSTLKELALLLRRINDILIENQSEIKILLTNITGITTDVTGIMSNVRKLFNVAKIVGILKNKN